MVHSSGTPSPPRAHALLPPPATATCYHHLLLLSTTYKLATTICCCPACRPVEHGDDGLRLQAHRHGRVQAVRCQLVLVHRFGPAHGLGDGDEEVVGLRCKGGPGCGGSRTLRGLREYAWVVGCVGGWPGW